MVVADPVGHGLDLLNGGRIDEAMRLLARVARNQRLDGDAQHAYGLALQASARFTDAVEQFERADRLKPDRWQVHQNLAAAYHGLKDFEAAHRHALRSLELNPDNPLVLYHLGDLHLIWGEMPEAHGYYDRSLALEPLMGDAWVGKMFAHDLIPGVTGEQALAARRRYAATFESRLARYRRPHRQSADPDRRLRIGYISGDFRDHTAAYMFGPLYEHHDRSQFQVFSYAAIAYEDSAGTWFRNASNAWRLIRNVPHAQVAQAIYEDEIDVLVDTAGFTSGGHLPVFCAKPAPLQVQAWGYLTGSGLSAMDAILVDDTLVPPEHEHHFAEQALRVPYALGFAPVRDEVAIAERPSRPLTFGHLGRSDKINPDAVSLWSAALRAYPESRMVLKDRGLSRERTQHRVLDLFAAEDISADRLDLRGESDRGDHLRTYNDVDVILDSVPQGGGTTTMEALWMGTPVVTLLGPRIIGRIAATTIHALGYDRWIASTRDEYVRKAGAAQADAGAHLRAELLASVVCDGKARTRHFEAAIRGLWRDYCQR